MSHAPNTRSSSDASGTTSVIFGDRPSVRLPRRIVPICVSEPMGVASPFRMASTPAIVVVLTAPKPTSRTPSLPRAGQERERRRIAGELHDDFGQRLAILQLGIEQLRESAEVSERGREQ